MTLTAEQKTFFAENGYLPYDRVLTGEELEALRRRSEDIAEGRLTHLPPQYIQLEAAFRDAKDAAPRLDTVRKMTHLCYYDDIFKPIAQKAAIVDIIEDLLGPNIKLYI